MQISTKNDSTLSLVRQMSQYNKSDGCFFFVIRCQQKFWKLKNFKFEILRVTSHTNCDKERLELKFWHTYCFVVELKCISIYQFVTSPHTPNTNRIIHASYMKDGKSIVFVSGKNCSRLRPFNTLKTCFERKIFCHACSVALKSWNFGYSSILDQIFTHNFETWYSCGYIG
jgi:hypothetical protein